jgi:hypothetical protein
MTPKSAGKLVLVAAIACTSAGCVRRTLTVNTVPEGAMVMLNDQPIGTSPVTTDFTWYGDYSVVVRKDGFETADTHKKIQTPWYELPGLDFVTENLMPFTVQDKHEMTVTLAPRKPIDKDQLLKDATEFRERTLFGNE